MAEETIDKSVVVWCPNVKLHIPDVREWTSLCLLHDQVIVWSFRHPVEENRIIVKEATKPLSKSNLAAEITFNNILKQLSERDVVRLLTFAELGKYKLPRSELARIVALKTNKENLLPVRETTGMIMSYAASKQYCCPLISNDIDFQRLDKRTKSLEAFSHVLAQSAICQLALPDFKAIHVEDLLEARNELKDELLEFRAGILKLTWLLHQQVQNKSDLEQIRNEANTLTNTKIKGSLLSLENRMRQHKKKGIRRMLFGTGRVIVEATKLFLPSGVPEKMISGGKGLLQLATEIDSAKPPEDQIATYLYKLRGKLKT